MAEGTRVCNGSYCSVKTQPASNFVVSSDGITMTFGKTCTECRRRRNNINLPQLLSSLPDTPNDHLYCAGCECARPESAFSDSPVEQDEGLIASHCETCVSSVDPLEELTDTTRECPMCHIARDQAYFFRPANKTGTQTKPAQNCRVCQLYPFPIYKAISRICSGSICRQEGKKDPQPIELFMNGERLTKQCVRCRMKAASTNRVARQKRRQADEPLLSAFEIPIDHADAVLRFLESLPNPYEEDDQITAWTAEFEEHGRNVKAMEGELANKGGRRHRKLMDAHRESFDAEEDRLRTQIGKHVITTRSTMDA